MEGADWVGGGGGGVGEGIPWGREYKYIFPPFSTSVIQNWQNFDRNFFTVMFAKIINDFSSPALFTQRYVPNLLTLPLIPVPLLLTPFLCPEILTP
jgi:hypothetical protein